MSVVVAPNEPRDFIYSWRDEDFFPTDDLGNVKNSCVGTKAEVQARYGRALEAKADGRFTKSGVEDLLARELPQHEARLKPFEKVLENHDARTTEMEQNLLACVLPDITEYTPTQAVREGQIWQWFSPLDRSKQLRVMQDALAEKDAETLSALINAPKSMKIIAPELREHLIERMLEDRDPEGVAKLARYRKAGDTLRFALQRAKELMRKDQPLPMRDRFIRGDGSK